MNKTELISKISEKAEISKKDAESALNALTNVIADALVDGGRRRPSVLPIFRAFRVLSRIVIGIYNWQIYEIISKQRPNRPVGWPKVAFRRLFAASATVRIRGMKSAQ